MKDLIANGQEQCHVWFDTEEKQDWASRGRLRMSLLGFTQFVFCMGVVGDICVGWDGELGLPSVVFQDRASYIG